MVTRTQPLETEHRKSPWRSGARPDPRPALCCAHHDGTARADYPLARAPLLVPPRGAPLSPMRVAGLGTSTIGTSLIGSDIPHAFGCINKPLVPCCASVGLGHFTNGPSMDCSFCLPWPPCRTRAPQHWFVGAPLSVAHQPRSHTPALRTGRAATNAATNAVRAEPTDTLRALFLRGAALPFMLEPSAVEQRAACAVQVEVRRGGDLHSVEI